MPNILRTTLKYTTRVQLNPTTGATAYNFFRMTSIYDPDYSGTGTQPLGHDQLAVFYERYRVVSARITANFFTNATSSAGNAIGAIYITDTPPAAVPTNIDTLVQQPNTKYVCFGPQNAMNPSKVSYGVNVKRMMGRWADGDPAGANFGQNPNENIYAVVAVAGVDASADPAAFDVQVQISFDVECSSLKQIGAS